MGACCSTGVQDDPGGVATGSALKMRKKGQKRLFLAALAAEDKTNEILRRIPGRMSTNGASSSACLFTQQGRKGTNQDAMVVWEGFAGRKDTVFCGVFDGHGPYGHLVARRVRDSLPSKLVSIWKARSRADLALQSAGSTGDINVARAGQQQKPIMELIDDDVYNDDERMEDVDTASVGSFASGEEEDDQEEGEHGPDSKKFVRWRDSFLEAFDSMDRDLKMHPTIDCFCSGTTAVTVLRQGEDLVIGNVGDSRAILARRADNKTIQACQLTVDLKPNIPREIARILKCNGRVFSQEDEPDVARVWLPYDDAPGLAMTRAFGDICLKDFGLIAEPEVTYYRIKGKDEFLVLATDGIWDVLSNKEVVDIVAGAPSRGTAARALVETAVRAWRLKYPSSKVDDCAVVCLYLKPAFTTNGGEAGKSAATAPDTPTCQDSPSVVLDDDGIKQADGSDQGKGFQGGPHSKASVEKSHPVRSLADVLSTAEDDEEWSALEGVVRVNSLLQLPRFLKGDKRARHAEI